MKVLGITGGVGSGKSQVLAYLQEKYHASVSQMDEVAKRLQKKGTPCYRKIVREFGTEMPGSGRSLTGSFIRRYWKRSAGISQKRNPGE